MNITPSNQTLILASENRFSNAGAVAAGSSTRRSTNVATQQRDHSVIDVSVGSVGSVELGSRTDDADEAATEPRSLVAQQTKLPVAYRSARTAVEHYALTQRLSGEPGRPKYIDVHA